MKFILPVLLVLFAAFSRLVPHAPNFTPMVAVALFSASYLERRHALVIPMLALFLSDALIGFYGPLMLFVYGSLVAVGALGFLMRGKVSLAAVLGFSFAGAVLFFLVTNFGVWILSGSVYPKTVAGLFECYVMGIPFFRNELLGSILYSGALFGIYEGVRKLFPNAKTA